MKVRMGFVSNSSSSSFTVIDASKGYDRLEGNDEYVDSTYHVGKNGKCEFGWEKEKTKDIDSKINWAYIQAEDNPLLTEMFERVIKENTGITEILYDIGNYDKTSDPDPEFGPFKEGMIDHQSHISENDSNMNIFESDDALRDFIFGRGSCIQTDNDND